jgi:hypothetical protein
MLSVQTGETPGGWITIPGGTLQKDPTSNIPRIGSGEFLSYDRAFNRWILATWNHVSPDGRSYVLTGGGADVTIVDVATGVSRKVTMPLAYGIWTVVDYTTSGIYLTLMAGLDYADPGLWRLNPGSGEVRKIDGTQFWSQVDSRAAWGVASSAGSLVLRRLDLQNGSTSNYLTVPYHQPRQPGDRLLELISLDADGRPLVLERDWQRPYPWHLALVSAPNMPFVVEIPSDWAAGWPIWDNGDPFQSGRELHGLLLARGIWMFGRNSFSGLALLGSDRVVRQVATGPGNIFAIAGGCH